MLEALGLDTQTESVYRTKLRTPALAAGDIADALGMSEPQVEHALRELARMALLQPSRADPGGLRPTHPQAALQALVARRQAEFAQLQQHLEESKAAVANLLAEHAELHPPVKAPDLEYVEGADAIDARLQELTDGAQWEICSFEPTEWQLPPRSEVTEARQFEAIERGVRYRTVFLDSIRNHQPSFRQAQSLVDHGSEVRTSPLLPLQMLLVDRALALVPVEPVAGSDIAVMVSSAGMVVALLALFQTTWKGSSPLGMPRQRDEEGLCAQRRQVLKLLAEGCTDDVIARRLGVSIRTARRVASDLLGRLGARSRFQAGAKAVARGWLDADDLDVRRSA